MSLRTPLRNDLEPVVDDRDAQRLWRGVRARRTVGDEPKAAWPGAIVGAALAAVLLLVVHLWPAPPQVALLAYADGRALAAIEAEPPSAGVADLSDGSDVARDAGTSLRLLSNEPGLVDLLLASGRARVHVQKGGPRKWIVECGAFSVEVVGTRFVVARDATHARVDVGEGAVLVRGDRVPDGVKRLVAGESFEVTTIEAVAAATASATASAVEPDTKARDASSPEPKIVSPPAASSWRALAKAADYGHAYEALGSAGVAGATSGATVDDLLTLADVARLSGHPSEAIAPLTRVADEHAGDPRASLAAFTLGRVLAASAPVAAVTRFEQAIRGGLPAPLVEDAIAHIADAKGHAGDRAGAAEAAARYLKSSPKGGHATDMQRWLAP